MNLYRKSNKLHEVIENLDQERNYQEKKKYPKSCDKYSLYNLMKNLVTSNGCGSCPNREKIEKIQEEKWK